MMANNPVAQRTEPADVGVRREFHLKEVRAMFANRGILNLSWLPALVMLAAAAGSARADWIQQSSPVSSRLATVDFVDANQGWICGYGGVILHTADGGDHWASQVSGTTLNLYGISFVDANLGFAAGDQGLVLRTTNGGAGWQVAHAAKPEDITFVGISAADAQHVVAAGTDYEGNPSAGWFACSTDGGTTWKNNYIFAQNGDRGVVLYHVQMLSGQVGYALGEYTSYDYDTTFKLYKTTDGWATESIMDDIPYAVCGLDFVDQFNGGFVSVNFGYYLNRTTDGGLTWVKTTVPEGQGISFPDLTRGWVVGHGGVIARSTDGGKDWAAQDSGVNTDLWSVDFVDDQVGAAVGTGGVILHTVDGGDPVSSVPATGREVAGRLLAAEPDPFHSSLQIDYTVARPGAISLVVLDVAGRVVRSLLQEDAVSGTHHAVWDGTGQNGRRVAPGVYYLRLSGAFGQERRPVVLTQ